MLLIVERREAVQQAFSLCRQLGVGEGTERLVFEQGDNLEVVLQFLAHTFGLCATEAGQIVNFALVVVEGLLPQVAGLIDTINLLVEVNHIDMSIVAGVDINGIHVDGEVGGGEGGAAHVKQAAGTVDVAIAHLLGGQYRHGLTLHGAHVEANRVDIDIAAEVAPLERLSVNSVEEIVGRCGAVARTGARENGQEKSWR